MGSLRTGAVGKQPLDLSVCLACVQLFLLVAHSPPFYQDFPGLTKALPLLWSQCRNPRLLSLYGHLFFYYVGSSVSGTGGGYLYSHFGWIGIVGMIGAYAVAGFALCRFLLIGQKQQTTGTPIY
ncbi:hypothetical protein [Paenibacillus illinoisensis]|uniref:hypothetical protein n=1 Tax=Paenibacillus illinoisensis TaxID=59845 RepID=UPI0011B83B5A|nr:hypothetical protein [Paenibacillus illinoisensis]